MLQYECCSTKCHSLCHSYKNQRIYYTINLNKGKIRMYVATYEPSIYSYSSYLKILAMVVIDTKHSIVLL